MNRSDRIAQTHLFMQDEFQKNISPRGVREPLWPSMIVLTGGQDVHRPFGYSAAQYFSYDDKWAFFYCPEVIVDVAAELEDLEFREWLEYIRAHINTHTRLATQDEATVDEHVFTVLPEARDLVGRVHDLLMGF